MASTPVAGGAAPGTPTGGGSTSAPTSTPAPASTPSTAPVSPAPVASPEISSVPAPIEAPAAPATATGARPDKSKFANTRDGQQQYLEENLKWDLEHPEEALEKPVEPAVAAPLAETAPKPEEKVEEAPKPQEEAKPKEDEPKIPEQVREPDPEIVAQWLKDAPELAAALEASPAGKAIKGQMFQMARTNARASEMLKIYANVEQAKFANTKSNAYVDIESSFRAAADNPDQIPVAMDKLADNFKVRDKEGKVQLDAAGNPIFHKDFEMMANAFAYGLIDDIEAEYKGLVESGDNNDDSVALGAIQYVRTLVDKYTGKGGSTSQIDLSKLTPEQREWQVRENARIADERKRLGLDRQTLTAEQRDAQRDTWGRDTRGKVGGLAGRFLKDFIAEKEKAGIYLPSYVTEAREGNQSIFARDLYNEFRGKVYSVAFLRDQANRLENAEPTPENAQALVEFWGRQLADYMPSLMEGRYAEITTKEKNDRSKRGKTLEEKQKVADVEPIGGSTPLTTGSAQKTDEQLMAEAYTVIDQKYPRGSISRQQRTEFALNEMNKLSTPALRR